MVIKRGEDYISPRGKHIKQWLCLCDCQLEKTEDERKYKLVPQGKLVSQKAQSCGCSNFRKNPKFVDWTNHKFGKFTVIKQIDRPKEKRSGTYWICKCECVNERIMISADIKRENYLSCGECSKNTYNVTGDYGIGITTKGEEFYFDLEDYDLIKTFTWCLNTHGYAIAWNKFEQKFVYMHRLVCGLDSNDKYVVDHMHHIKHDNRKEGLRVCTHAENTRNCKLSKNNTSGIIGVVWAKNIDKWYAQIMVNYKTIHLGAFDDFEDAVKCRKEAEIKYFGEFRYKIKEE